MKIIIIGGGFGGLKLARLLGRKEGIEVLLIDKRNYHQFQPLFYQVATAGLDASNISFPLRKIFQNSPNLQFRLAEVKRIDAPNQKVVTNIGDFNYDQLVIATGAYTNFFNNQQVQQNAFSMKTTEEALLLRYKLIQNFEDALIAKDYDAAALQKLMNIVVVGAGPTGVEVCGALAEMRNNVLPKDYPDLDFKKMHIYLIEGSTKTLGTMSEKSTIQSRAYLEKLAVNIITETMVKSYDGDLVTLSTGKTISTKIVIWAAGITGNVPEGVDHSLLVRGNRIKVDRTNKLAGFDNIYAIGDVCYMETPLYPNGHPQVANVAINQAKNLARNLLRQLNGNKHYQDKFEYNDKGSMATVGRNLAVVDIPHPKIHFGGFVAWLVWMGLHLLLILGVKNRLQIFINWVYKYFTYDQSLRLLFRDFYKQEK
ncbi:MAG TPA: NAD(P)/FAD-dependent oxidoreductase [Panacibacter sp.]|nr:NAD(P)/FAD-dependent oxidoreductase [Panacibacter sp.]HNP43540.1 NAD(P)/FAD-dependent oxidoreductase [Panacibacter sp.]